MQTKLPTSTKPCTPFFPNGDTYLTQVAGYNPFAPMTADPGHPGEYSVAMLPARRTAETCHYSAVCGPPSAVSSKMARRSQTELFKTIPLSTHTLPY